MADEKLVRGIGRWDLTAILINTIIGAGIFGLPAKVHALIGTYSLIAFFACAVIIGFIVLCYAEVSSRFTSTGGPYLYAREAFGSVVGFEVGWLYWIVRVTTFAANCNLFVTYLGFFVPGASSGIFRIVAISMIVFLIFAINLIGVKQSALATNLFTAGKLIPLFIFVAVGIFFIQPENFAFGELPEYGAFASAVLLLIYAFVGFEVGVVMGGETKDPQRNTPFALLVALGIVATLYILIQVVSIGTLPGLASSERPLADASIVFLGVFGASFITIGALISILGNLNVGFLGSTRLLYAMSENRELPNALAKTHSRFKTPWVAILLTSLVIFVLTVYSTFLTAVAIATITRLLVYATTCLALPIFRRRDDAPQAKFSTPLGVLAAILSLILIGWLLTRVDLTKEGLPILIAALVGLVIFAANRFLGNRSLDNAS
ncbi:APC family permease [Leptolyngbya sp. 7M]|uniref:APC family permease n=1 Tax=Leptolyngbya sp. 7M TaxID=2812896 RepID=UPI001B8BDE48|nr:APC family permease [Leptolyngbya sp. 7M]QYO65224.1 APC family permease [Leptolyngbya sp. 7M]